MSSSISYDGGDYTDFGAINPLTGASEISISFWINPDDLGNGYFFGRNYNSSVSIGFDGTKLEMLLRDGVTSNLANMSSDDTLTTLLTVGEWSHICCTWDANGGSNLYGLFVNGVSKGTSLRFFTANIDVIAAGSGNFRIGDIGLGSGFYFDGDFAYTKIFDRALSQSEVLELMHKPKSIQKSCVGEWDLLTLTPQDQSGVGNDGTNNGATAGGDGPPVYFPKLK